MLSYFERAASGDSVFLVCLPCGFNPLCLPGARWSEGKVLNIAD